MSSIHCFISIIIPKICKKNTCISLSYVTNSEYKYKYNRQNTQLYTKLILTLNSMINVYNYNVNTNYKFSIRYLF